MNRINHVKVNSKIYRDNTGTSIDLPTILVEQNGKVQILEQLLQYQLKYCTKSMAWHNKLVQSVRLLLDYINANQDNYTSAKEFFDTFAEALYSGTIGEEGRDPSWLGWTPKKAKTSNTIIYHLTTFSDWLYENYGAVQLNPWREATSYEQRLNWMAQINKRQRCFLAHLHTIHDISETAKKARSLIIRPKIHSSVQIKSFPEEKFGELLNRGFKKEKKNIELDIIDSYNWRDIAITILMHGGGIRHSEAFHLWIDDVYINKDGLAIVRIYHPSEGAVPEKYQKGLYGKCINTREALLKIKYGLRPRNKYPRNDIRFAGWKNPLLDDGKSNFMQVYWYEPEWGYFFAEVWENYMKQRRREGIPETNPYAFVSHSRQYKGDMLSMESHRKSHTKAVEKIGLKVAKDLGTTQQGHRHAYGQRLRNAGFNELIIRKCMHHNSIESQEVYTQPSIDTITNALNSANTALNSGLKLPQNTTIDTSYFDKLFKQEYKQIQRYRRRSMNG